MGKVIRFPVGKTAAPPAEPEPPPPLTDRQVQIERVLRGVLLALRKGTVRPEQMFVLFTQDDTFSYLNLGYPPDELVRAVDVVLQDIARGYDSD